MIDIKYISKLANLSLTSKEEKIFKKQLDEILLFVDQLNEVKSDSETDQLTDAKEIERSNDNIINSLNVSDSLRNSKSILKNYFKVKLILKNKSL